MYQPMTILLDNLAHIHMHDTYTYIPCICHWQSLMWAAPDLQEFNFKMCYHVFTISLYSILLIYVHIITKLYTDHKQLTLIVQPSGFFPVSNKRDKSFSLMTTLTFKKLIPCQSESHHTINSVNEASANTGVKHKCQVAHTCDPSIQEIEARGQKRVTAPLELELGSHNVGAGNQSCAFSKSRRTHS